MAEHWCQIHKTKFFKTANMKSYAHPVKDSEGKTISWCNEDAQEVAKLEPKQPESPPPQQDEPVNPRSVSQEIRENMEWKDQQIERNMWWRILADLVIHKEIDTTKPAGKALRTALMAKMLSVLDLKVTSKEP